VLTRPCHAIGHVIGHVIDHAIGHAIGHVIGHAIRGGGMLALSLALPCMHLC